MQETWVRSLGWEDSLEKEMANCSSILPVKSRGQRSLASCSPGVYMCVLVAQPCLTLCDPMDCSRPGSSVHGTFQQEYWNWLLFSYLGALPDPGIEPTYPALRIDFLPSELREKPMGLDTTWWLNNNRNYNVRIYMQIVRKWTSDIFVMER